MGPNLQLGDMYQSSDNKQTLFRKHNGFSPDAIINAVKKGHEIKEQGEKKKIELLDKQRMALLEGNEHIKALLDASKALSNPKKGKLLGEKDVFAERSVDLTSSSPSVAANQVVQVTCLGGATEASMSIKVARVASKDVITSSVALPSKTADITLNETRIYIKGVEVVVPANATLEEIAGAINGKSAESGVTAYARKFGDADYRLYVGGTTEGEKITLSSVLNQLEGEFEASDTPLGLSGTVVVGAEEVVITSDMTLQNIATLLSTLTDVSASVSGSGPYTLSVTQSAVPVNLSDIATEKLFDQLGLSESASASDDLKAMFYVDNNPTPILSSTNHVEGLLHKTTVHLLGPSSGETITANIQRNKVGISDGISKFVSAYNALMKFAADQTERDADNNYEPKEEAYLAKNRDFIRLVDKVKSICGRVTPGVAGVNHLSEIGILRDYEGVMTINEEKFSEALTSKVESIEKIFASVVQNVSGGYFRVIATATEVSTDISDNDLCVSVTKNSSGEYSARLYLYDGENVLHEEVIANGSSNMSLSAEGYITLRGPSDSKYKGFTFFYGGPEMTTPVFPNENTETQTFRVTQGFSDLLATRLSSATLLNVNSEKEADQKNDMDKLTFRVKQQRALYETKLKEMQKKHAAQIKREEAKAAKFQAEMEKLSSLEATLKSMTASMFS